LIVAFRVGLLAIAAGAVVVALVVGFVGRRGEEAGVLYACPMHPEVRGPAPGECPICRMALEPIGRDPAAMGRHDMAGMPDITAVDNIRKHRIVDFVRRRSLLPQAREMRGAAAVGDDGTLTAIFYNDQIQAMAADESGTLSLSRSPEITLAVRRTPDPPVPWDRSTSAIQFRLDTRVDHSATARAAIVPGDAGWIDLERKARDLLVVPASAVLQSPEGPYVLAVVRPGRFEKRPIEIGETFLKHGFAVVLSGLKLNDRVVSRAAFFMDAARRLGVTSTFDPVAPGIGVGVDPASDRAGATPGTATGAMPGALQ